MLNDGKKYLTEKDIEKHPIWFFDEADDLIYPVFGVEDFPEKNMDLYIRATFVAKSGLRFNGYIIGLKNIFCIVLFCGNKTHYLNKNSLKDCLKIIETIGTILNLKIVPQEFSPIHYQTTIDISGYNNISGDFDIFKKRTNTERLS